jgi:hypothetical protein
MLRLILALVLCLTAVVAADVTGTRQLAVQTSQGSGTPTVELQQKGEALTGTFHSPIFGDAKITGSVKGSATESGFEGDAGGQKLKVTYKGTNESATVMKGTAEYTGFDDKATWPATKK